MSACQPHGYSVEGGGEVQADAQATQVDLGDRFHSKRAQNALNIHAGSEGLDHVLDLGGGVLTQTVEKNNQ